ncbi:MAG: hypothetical protein ACRCSY_03995 [Cetobacterium sp.]
MTEEEKRKLEEERKAQELARQLGGTNGAFNSSPIIPATDDLGMVIEIGANDVPADNVSTASQLMPTDAIMGSPAPVVEAATPMFENGQFTHAPQSQDLYPTAPVATDEQTQRDEFIPIGQSQFQHANRDYGNGEMLFRSILGAGLAYLGARAMGGDSQDGGAAAVLAGMQTLGNDMHRKARFANIEELTKRGYTPESIEQYVYQGGIDSLKEMPKAEWKSTNDGSGRVWAIDPKTGDVMFRGEEKPKVFKTTQDLVGNKLITRQLDKNGNIIGEAETYREPKAGGAPRNAQTQVINGVLYERMPNGEWKAVAGGAGSTSSGTDMMSGADYFGGDINSPMGLHRRGNQFMVGEVVGGKYKVRAPNNQELTTYGLSSPDVEDTSGQSTARKALEPYMTGEKEIPRTQANITAALNPFSDKPWASDLIAKWNGGDENALNAYLNLMDADGMIKGIEMARKAGASGINSPAEFETFKAGFPPVDRSSTEALRESIARQDAYIADWNSEIRKKQERFPVAGGKKSITPVSDSTDDFEAWRKQRANR